MLAPSVSCKLGSVPSTWKLDATLSTARVPEFDPPLRPAASTSAAEAQLDKLSLEFGAHLRQNDLSASLKSLKGMLQAVNAEENESKRVRLARKLDEHCQAFAGVSFAPYQGSTDHTRIWLGLEAIQMQLSSAPLLPHPYNLVPKRTLLLALKAVAKLGQGDRPNHEDSEHGDERAWMNRNGLETAPRSPADAAFRILQRLLTGAGVRTRQPAHITDVDFNMVMNAFVTEGRMDMAHRVAALQERTPHAPPLSAVAYSILVKGCGKAGDADQVTKVVRKAAMNRIQPDVVMMNSILDAYVNCKSLEDARSLFQSMKERREGDSLGFRLLPRPNPRTYNIYLKGLANEGLLDEAVAVSNEMMRSGVWDAVTTNTLVHAAVVRTDYDRAESILGHHTAMPVTVESDHPNVEAYTELIDAYAKSSQLERALTLFQTMKERGVDPNEITFTCLVSGLALKKEVAQARKLIRYMSSVGIQPTCATYSALISGLLGGSQVQGLDDEAPRPDPVRDVDVDEALRILRDMIQAKVRPSPAIVSTLVRALAQCAPPRIREARLLVDKLERDGVIVAGSVKVATALISACGVAQDAVGCVEAFRSITRMDAVAVNAFLDACCRCGRDRLAFDTFDYYFRRKSSLTRHRLKPDVISYTTLVSSLLKQPNSSAIKRAQQLYEEMKVRFSILPDNTMIDSVLKAFVRVGRSRSLTKDESMFVVRVLRDAENLSWSDGQLARRKRAVRALVGTNLRDVWLATDDSDDDLFKRKGWNQVDSGFRLWGSPLGQTDTEPQSKKVVDQFLESKGWNDVDSGFRII